VKTARGPLAALALVLWLAAPAPAAERALFVAAASDLRFAMDELVADYQRRQPDVAVKVSYGSSGNFFAQLAQKAPFDLFFSADAEYPRRLDADGCGLPGSFFVYAVGRLAVWMPRSAGVDLMKRGIKALQAPEVKKIAIANPRHAPYGRAAEAALRHFGLYDELQSKLVLGENVAQAAQFAQTGAADAALIAYSLALAPAMQQDGRFWEVPTHAYPRMEQGGLALGWARDAAAARGFRAYVLGGDGRAILKRWGFFLPD
jgi:molybdate transport system substrate-binding protein